MNRNTHLLTALVFAAGALAASVMGCELISTVDRSLIDNGSGGGTTTTTTTTTTSTGGGCTPATVATDCPPPANECVTATCDMGACGTINAVDGTAVTAQTARDCKKVVCDGAGMTKEVGDDTDLPDDSNPCTDDTCSGGIASNTAAAPTTSGQCMASGKAGVCGDPAGSAAKTCVECNVGTDCVSKVCGLDNKCLPAMCGDGTQDGTETDKDCGGSCSPCADNLKCLIAGDCASAVCDPAAKTCTPATCSDTVQNQGESDTDCGAACAGSSKLCGTGKKCGLDGDCQSGVCDPTVKTCTAPSCTDGVQNQGESDTDCGAACAPSKLCSNGKKCALAGDCQSGACDATAKTCTPASCTDGLKNMGEIDVDCGGTSTCPRCANGLGCAAPTDCQSGICNGSNKCAACTLDTECQPGDLCNGGACAPKQANGALCTGGNGNQCISGFCADGVCCDKACSGTCQACTATLKGTGMDGTCGSTKAGGGSKGACSPSSASTCGDDGLCDGAGACEKWPATTVCVAAACVANVHTSVAACSGSGTCGTPTMQNCGAYVCQTAGCPTSCAADTDCTAASFCDMTANPKVCTGQLAAGGACTRDRQCTSNNCKGNGTCM